jgi:hypothetical protein
MRRGSAEDASWRVVTRPKRQENASRRIKSLSSYFVIKSFCFAHSLRLARRIPDDSNTSYTVYNTHTRSAAPRRYPPRCQFRPLSFAFASRRLPTRRRPSAPSSSGAVHSMLHFAGANPKTPDGARFLVELRPPAPAALRPIFPTSTSCAGQRIFAPASLRPPSSRRVYLPLRGAAVRPRRGEQRCHVVSFHPRHLMPTARR